MISPSSGYKENCLFVPPFRLGKKFNILKDYIALNILQDCFCVTTLPFKLLTGCFYLPSTISVHVTLVFCTDLDTGCTVGTRNIWGDRFRHWSISIEVLSLWEGDWRQQTKFPPTQSLPLRGKLIPLRCLLSSETLSHITSYKFTDAQMLTTGVGLCSPTSQGTPYSHCPVWSSKADVWRKIDS